jgi:hypothetical protein
MLVNMLLQAVQAASPDQVCGGGGAECRWHKKVPTLWVQKHMQQEVVAALHAAFGMQEQR